MKSLRRIPLRLRQATVCEIDGDLLARSRAARVGHYVIQLAAVLRAIEPTLVALAAVLLIAVSAFAQQPGGNIFSGNDQQLGTGLREAIRYGRNALFLGGVALVGWGIVNYAMERAWGKQIVGGLLCLGFGGAVSLIYSFSQGSAVNLDTDLGN